MHPLNFACKKTLVFCAFGLLSLVQGCSRNPEIETVRGDQLIAEMASNRHSAAIQILRNAGFDKERLSAIQTRLLQSSRALELKDPFVRAAIIGRFDRDDPEELKIRIRQAEAAGFTHCFWEIETFHEDWRERYDRELAGFPAAPIGVLNPGLADPNFIAFYQWFDRYAERLHSVVINADKLDNFHFKEADQQREASRVLGALYRLIKARQPDTFVWVRLVRADDQSDVNWLKNLSFEPDGLVLWNVPSSRVPFEALERQYRPLTGEKTAFMAGEFCGFWSLFQSETNAVEAGRVIDANLAGFVSYLEQKHYRGLAPNWRMFRAMALSKTNAEPSLPAAPSENPKVLDWTLQDTLGAYERIGMTNAAWDKPAREAIELYTRLRVDYTKTEDSSYDHMAFLLGNAMAAGCADPLIQYFYTAYGLWPKNQASHAIDQQRTKATDAMLKSRYSDARKFLACLAAAEAIQRPANQTNLPPSAERCRKQAEECLAAVVRDTSVPDEEAVRLCQQWTQAKHLNGTQHAAFAPIEKALSEFRPASARAWMLKGNVYIESAWEARGHGWAGTVRREGWKLMEERLAIAEQCLEKAWALDPTVRELPERMITVELGQGKGRKRMELWFDRAMGLNPNNDRACKSKLNYLEPKWHGSPGAMLEFGRECVSSPKWGGRVPLILFEAHLALSKYLPAEQENDYWKQPGVWKDLKSSFEKFFQLNPNASDWRQAYFYYACMCEEWDDACRQLSLLGQIDYSYFGGKPAYEQMVRTAREKGRVKP